MLLVIESIHKQNQVQETTIKCAFIQMKRSVQFMNQENTTEIKPGYFHVFVVNTENEELSLNCVCGCCCALSPLEWLV